ncbi:hypothetical protein TRFO_42045 [Tritrichomonas foetus]|uniref:Uncharacterized protein n=1 Tax=Tritrichomonas foetus TaxID=1144522 RepID=A0A1J4KXY5_9EUKA|nr:hypothetical protein TRFO_42045 [Tritrichomonas foetus]|eukprot:OHT16095.1 hypothetical protein TRFO_42045 [Tritrichomonas foetus]
MNDEKPYFRRFVIIDCLSDNDHSDFVKVLKYHSKIPENSKESKNFNYIVEDSEKLCFYTDCKFGNFAEYATFHSTKKVNPFLSTICKDRDGIIYLYSYDTLGELFDLFEELRNLKKEDKTPVHHFFFDVNAFRFKDYKSNPKYMKEDFQNFLHTLPKQIKDVSFGYPHCSIYHNKKITGLYIDKINLTFEKESRHNIIFKNYHYSFQNKHLFQKSIIIAYYDGKYKCINEQNKQNEKIDITSGERLNPHAFLIKIE